jgi:ribosomal protein S12 methylthiotransferase accessory factor YcaO
MLLAGALAGVALADGDPASDVLVSRSLFLPQDAAIAPNEQAQVASLIARAANRGYPVRVALIASRADLGSVTALWQQPQSYADFLGQELALTHKEPLLVLMPNGYGLHLSAGGAARQIAAMRRLPPPGRELAPAAVNAILRLAAVSGHQLPAPRASAAPSSASLGLVSWLALALGALLVAAAWGASLRARPFRRAVGSGA